MAKKKKKKPSLMDQAKKLGQGKYAPVLAEIAGNQRSNLQMYNVAGNQRTAALNREAGSIQAAGATTQKQLGDFGAANASAYQGAMAKSQQGTKDLLDKVNANNTGMLSSLQADMRARGVEGWEQLSPITQRLGNQNELLGALGQFQQNRLGEGAANDVTGTTRMQGMAKMLETSDTSAARGAAQSDLSDLYNKFLEARLGMDTSRTKTLLEQQDFTHNTYLTLKERAAQRAAEKAQAKLQAAIASGNLAYKNTALQVNTQYKYDSLAARTSQKDIENSLKERGFTHKQAMDLANYGLKKSGKDLDWEKFNWSKANPKKSAAVNWADLLAGR